MKQPCGRDCPDRRGGCSATCPKWAEWVAYRNANYGKKLKDDDLRDYTARQASRRKAASVRIKAQEATKK